MKQATKLHFYDQVRSVSFSNFREKCRRANGIESVRMMTNVKYYETVGAVGSKTRI